MQRLLLVSNRLPVTLSATGAGITVERSSGGLANGLRGPHERSSGLWIGWPGELEVDTTAVRAELSERLDSMGIVPVFLTGEEVRSYYEGYANGVLWPLFHYLTGQVPLAVEGWASYQSVNERFAEAVVRHYRPGDLIWVHDYQLMALPGLLRARLPDARIGFFLHIPFPTSELFVTLPNRAELLRGLLGADVIGFHTRAYQRHFLSSVQRVLGFRVTGDAVECEQRRVEVGAFPMGVDALALQQRTQTDEVAALRTQLRRDTPGSLLLGIDRLDYTKGMPRRLLAYQRFLQARPEWHGRVRLLQIAVPSRLGLRSYRNFRDEVSLLVGRINGEFGTPSWTPVQYLHRSVPEKQLLALYAAADVMLVTPIRDGMNLVAKEFVSARSDNDGVLVLSEFAGAAEELRPALLVNPYDIEALAEAYHQALVMEKSERAQRMRSLREIVFHHDVHWWVDSFLKALHAQPQPGMRLPATLVSEVGAADPIPDALAAWNRIEQTLSGTRPVLFLDFDGTLTRIVHRPDQALLSPMIRSLLARLQQHMPLAIVSGRKRDDLQMRVGLSGLIYAGSHGFDIEGPGNKRCQVATEYEALIHQAAAELCARTAGIGGVIIENKTFSVAIHYRMVAPADQSRVLAMVDEIARREGSLRKRYGKKVVELAPAVSWDKGTAVHWILSQLGGEGAPLLPVFVGDDLTDEDAFGAIAENGISVVVGHATRSSQAKYALRDVRGVYAFLSRLLDWAES